MASIIQSNEGSSAPTRALVVEDIKVDCVILMHMLHKLQCEATAVENGKEAVDLFVEGKTFDIVLSDKDMPVMSGPEVYIYIIYIRIFQHASITKEKKLQID